MKCIGIIPARYASSRLPAKLLLELDGKTILESTYRQASSSKLLTELVIATDDERIYKVAESFGAKVYMTRSEHQSGTDRIAELASTNQDWQIIVNIQADEPFVDPCDIDMALEPFIHEPSMQIVSLYHEISDMDEINNPNNVKVVTNLNDEALYFSRSAIPFSRDGTLGLYKKHIGLYAYRREVLLALSKLTPSTLEQIEKLEQLRALANGYRIKMLKSNSQSIGIDSEADYTAALLKLKSLRKL
jgi:3-deoxy-manno-octulosonate cytidylyltransferase (CMP-KDO synthetase)